MKVQYGCNVQKFYGNQYAIRVYSWCVNVNFGDSMSFAVDFHNALRTLIALVAIMNPFGVIPFFLAFTNGDTPEQRLQTAKTAARAVAIVLLVIAFVGEYILQFFGISIAAFQVAGGLVLLLIALNMLQGKSSAMRQGGREMEEGIAKEDVSVVPLAIPLLAGPGTMVTVIVAHHADHGWLASGFLVVNILLIATLAYVALRLAGPVSKRLGVSGIKIATRIFGLILASIAITFLSDGLTTLFPVLHGAGL